MFKMSILHGDPSLNSLEQLQPGGLPDPAIGRNKRSTCREANTSRTVVNMGHSAAETRPSESKFSGLCRIRRNLFHQG